MNRIPLLLTVCLLFSFCGPTEAEIQSRIDSAVEEALVETTSTTSTTSSSSTTSTTTTTIANYSNDLLRSRYSGDVIKDYIVDWPVLLSIDITEVTKYQIMSSFEGDNIDTIFIEYSNGCIFESDAKIENFYPNSKCKESKYTEDGFVQNVKLEQLIIRGKVKNSVTQKPYTIILNSENSRNGKTVILPNGYAPCCHKFNFSALESQLFTFFKNYFKTVVITTTTTTSTTTTSTTTTTVFVDTEAPVWSNDPISFSKVNSTYLDILWGQATDNVQVKQYKIFMNGNLVKTIPEGNTKRTTILGLSPDTLYNFEIFACDNSGNCSTVNPTASKRTPGSSSSGSSSSGSSSSGSSSEGNTTTTTLACLDDDEPPVLVSYSYSPDSVDVSNSPGQVEVLLTVTDNCSGVGTGFYGIDVTTTPSTGFSTASLISGTNTNGVWKAVINIPQNHFQSTFSITLYPLGDNRQNTGGFTQLGTFEVINNP